MAWCFEDEVDDFTDGILGQLTSAIAVVPPVWVLEVANVLLVAERKHRITEAQSARFVELLRALPIIVAEAGPADLARDLLDLGRSHALSAYDAAYLDLAMREGLALATRDDALRRAARKRGVALVGLHADG